MRSAVPWLCCVACSYTPSPADPQDDEPPPDSMVIPGDTGDAPPPGCTPFVFGDVCALTPTDPFSITGPEMINTDDDPRCVTFPQASGSDACLIYATSLEIVVNGGLVAFGTRPLILASSTTLTIDGKLDGSSRRLGTRGPNSNFATCTHAVTPEADGGGGGGGAGGSFAALGGNGGTGDTDTSSGTAGDAVRGEPGASVPAPAFARGGCGGQRGGNGSTGEIGGAPGPSGGAIALLAVESVTIGGVVTANGAGGDGGDTQSGGGGAGSGGLVIVESATISFSGVITANGGGGGEGGNRHNSVNIDGNPGADGTESTAASGGSGATPFGGPGGTGSFSAVTAGISGTNSIVGGGGGGGAAGYIVFVGARTGNGVSSPAIIQQ